MRALLLGCALTLFFGRGAACESPSLPSAAPAITQYPVPASYELKRDRIEMRDGACLDTFILAPKGSLQALPILLVRTPYDPTAEWILPEAEFLRAGYVFVTQSSRGRYGSEGQFVQMRPYNAHKRSRSDIDESSDAFDTIDWLVKHVPKNNGRVGLRGISYNGFYAAAGMIDAHPALKAVSPQAPQADWFIGDDTHHNGAFLLASTFNFMMSCDRLNAGLRTCAVNFNPPPTDGYQFFLSLGPLSNIDRQYLHGDSPEWQVMMTHGTYDELWQRRNLLPHLGNVRPAVLAVSGWYDANNLYGTLHIFERSGRNRPPASPRLVVGPWTHAQWGRDGGESVGPLQFGAPTATEFIRKMELPFFESYLKGDGHPDLPVASVFDTGSNQWHRFQTWPPKAGRSASLCLGAGGSLRLSLQSCSSGGSKDSYDEYVSDPRKPVPFVPDHGMDMDADYMSRDQRFTSGRADVLRFVSGPLSADTTVAGPISPRLVVSTSGTDSDWVVKVIDVRPDGFQQLVRGDVMRGKFRASFSSPSPMRPNQATVIRFTMLDVYHTFRKGHRILVQVQSSWFPLIDRNPQRYVDIYSAREDDFQIATQRVYHSSRIDMTVLPTGTSGGG